MTPTPGNIPQVSSVVSQYVQEQLQASDPTSCGFNFCIQQTAVTYSVTPFTLSMSSTPPSLFSGRYDIPTLLEQGSPFSQYNIPFAIVSVAKDEAIGKLAMRVTSSNFSGSVIMSVDFYIPYPQSNVPPDGEAMFHAVEDAVTYGFNNPGSFANMPSGVTYNNEIMIEQGNMQWRGDRWLQMIACTLVFYRVT